MGYLKRAAMMIGTALAVGAVALAAQRKMRDSKRSAELPKPVLED
jgi:ABC-type nickel/cobalt efflux system permease component RcnA